MVRQLGQNLEPQPLVLLSFWRPKLTTIGETLDTPSFRLFQLLLYLWDVVILWLKSNHLWGHLITEITRLHHFIWVLETLQNSDQNKLLLGGVSCFFIPFQHSNVLLSCQNEVKQYYPHVIRIIFLLLSTSFFHLKLIKHATCSLNKSAEVCLEILDYIIPIYRELWAWFQIE